MWEGLPPINKLALDANAIVDGNNFYMAQDLLDVLFLLRIKSVSLVVNTMPETLETDFILTQPQGNPRKLLAPIPAPGQRSQFGSLPRSWYETEDSIDRALKRGIQEGRRRMEGAGKH